MKRFACLNLRSFALCIAGLDILVACGMLCLCSYYLYNDYMSLQNMQNNEVQILSPFGALFMVLVNYVLVHEFSQAFYLIVTITICLKAFVNLLVGCLLLTGIKKQRLLCIAPWLINTLASLCIEIGIYISLEIKIDEVDASLDRRIARSVIFGVFIVLNMLFSYGIYAYYRLLQGTTNDNRALQESIVETSGMFQHIKV